jgi:EmrB/QacA subfamily drug resistance transporter
VIPVDRRRAPGRLALLLLCAAQFMVILDFTIVNVALPSIGAELGFSSQAQLQYVVSLYALTFGGFLILAGRMADLFGRRRLLVAGLLVFSGASLAAAIAPTSGALLAARAAQGLGASIASPAALSLLTTLYAEGRERNRALGAWAAVGAAGGAAGPILGGAFTDSLGWEWIFLLNVPIGLVAVAAAWRLLPEARAPGPVRGLDLPGALAVTLGLALLIQALDVGREDGFLAPTSLAHLAAAAGLLVAFGAIESRSQHPLVSFRLFRIPGVAGANLGALLAAAVVASQLFLTTLYAQRVLGLSPLEAGLAFLPHALLALAGSALASRATGRFDAGRVLAGGLALLAVGSVLLAGVSPGGAYGADLLPGLALSGLGLGIAYAAMTIGATTGVVERQQGLASGVVNTARQVGAAVGIALVASVALTPPQGEPAGVGGTLTEGYSTGYLIGAAAATLGAVLAMLLRDRPRSPKDQPVRCAPTMPSPSFTPTRSATRSRSVLCFTMIDIVRCSTGWSTSSAPSSSSARAQSIDSAIEGGFFRSSARTMWTTSTSLRAILSSSSGACRWTISSSRSTVG